MGPWILVEMGDMEVEAHPPTVSHSSSWPSISIGVLSVIVAGVAILVSKMLFGKTASSSSRRQGTKPPWLSTFLQLYKTLLPVSVLSVVPTHFSL